MFIWLFLLRRLLLLYNKHILFLSFKISRFICSDQDKLSSSHTARNFVDFTQGVITPLSSRWKSTFFWLEGWNSMKHFYLSSTLIYLHWTNQIGHSYLILSKTSSNVCLSDLHVVWYHLQTRCISCVMVFPNCPLTLMHQKYLCCGSYGPNPYIVWPLWARICSLALLPTEVAQCVTSNVSSQTSGRWHMWCDITTYVICQNSISVVCPIKEVMTQL